MTPTEIAQAIKYLIAMIKGEPNLAYDAKFLVLYNPVAILLASRIGGTDFTKLIPALFGYEYNSFYCIHYFDEIEVKLSGFQIQTTTDIMKFEVEWNDDALTILRNGSYQYSFNGVEFDPEDKTIIDMFC
jgi:hypothetical protein